MSHPGSCHLEKADAQRACEGARRGRTRRETVNVVVPETGDGAEVDTEELRQLQSLGLPTAFTSTQARLHGPLQQMPSQRADSWVQLRPIVQLYHLSQSLQGIHL